MILTIVLNLGAIICPQTTTLTSDKRRPVKVRIVRFSVVH